MKKGLRIAGIVLLLAAGGCEVETGCCPGGCSGEIVATGAELVCVSKEFEFTEGPHADAAGNVYFTDQPNDRIMKYTVEGKMETFMQPCGRSNGLYFDNEGRLVACADEKNELWLIDVKDKSHKVLVKDYKGKSLNAPNDVWVRPDGGLYFTDPFYKRSYWQRGPMEQDGQHVYFLSADYQKLIRVTEDLTQPNGIIGTADGKKLYVADIGAGKTYVYDIQADGTLINKKLFCSIGSDGMTLDCCGNLYLTGKGVPVFDSTGKQIKQIDVPEGWTANICFGGSDFKTLFITASKGLYTLKMNTCAAGMKACAGCK
jgi:gluconolactonase